MEGTEKGEGAERGARRGKGGRVWLKDRRKGKGGDGREGA